MSRTIATTLTLALAPAIVCAQAVKDAGALAKVKLFEHGWILHRGITMEVRVLDDDDQPIAGASVRARFVRRRSWHWLVPQEPIGTWTAETDADGTCRLETDRAPPDVRRCRVCFDIVARGFVDVQQRFPLRRYLRSTGNQADQCVLRLKRGRPLTGRIVGADGRPVAGARLHAVTAVGTGNRRVRVACYRPRGTDAEGRFELPVPPNVETEIIVYTSQWAPKHVIVGLNKLSAGDIQLERGTTVSGKLVREDGEPAGGYWVVADNHELTGPKVMERLLRVAVKAEPDGSFALPPLKGHFSIWAPPTFERWHTEDYVLSPEPRLPVLPQDRVFDGTGDRVELELRASPGVCATGQVTQPDGKPAKGTVVFLQRRVPSTIVPLTFEATETGDDGRFVFDSVPKGLKNVQITVPLIIPWRKHGKTHLRAFPLPSVEGAQQDGTVRVEELNGDLLNIDFKYEPLGAR